MMIEDPTEIMQDITGMPLRLMFNGKRWKIDRADFAPLVSWLLDDADGSENTQKREIAITNAIPLDEKPFLSDAWHQARDWAGDIATRYTIDARFSQIADALSIDY